MGAIFAPSMMCADYGHLSAVIEELESCKVDRFHLDIMDGKFVPHFAMGMQDVAFVCKNTKLKKSIHLMIEDPGRYVERFVNIGADIIYIHPESDYHPATTLQRVVECGAEAGVVLSPGTSVESVIELFHIAKHVMIMGVNPGQAGQMFIPYVEQKIMKVIELKKEYGLEVSVDGACNDERIQRWYSMGVDGFVLGTAALFNERRTFKETINTLRAITGERTDD